MYHLAQSAMTIGAMKISRMNEVDKYTDEEELWQMCDRKNSEENTV